MRISHVRSNRHERCLNHETRVEDIKELFGKYGEVRDVYCPLNYYTK